ncbi:MAG TPA: hypothetical protein HPP56_09805, partial [Nitrospirae bacterium]|nr:hypothetical protein [Nitrospirota bacterium]
MIWYDWSIKKKFVTFFLVILFFLCLLTIIGFINMKRTDGYFVRWNQLETYIYSLNMQEIAHLDLRYGLQDAMYE